MASEIQTRLLGQRLFLSSNCTWDVDENVVKTDIEWFRSHRSEMELDWHDIIEQETGIFY